MDAAGAGAASEGDEGSDPGGRPGAGRYPASGEGPDPVDRAEAGVAAFPGDEAGARESVCRVGRHLYESALVGGRAGNLSVRLDAGRLLVTPRGAHKGRLAPGDLVVVPLDVADRDDRRGQARAPAQAPPGREVDATSELPFHRAVYRSRPDVAAAVHTHAPALVAAGMRGTEVAAPFPEIGEAVGAVGRVPFRPSGSRALAEAVEEAARAADLLLLERHGTLALAATPEEARDRTELAELTAWAALLAQGAGLELDLHRVSELHRRIVERARDADRDPRGAS